MAIVSGVVLVLVALLAVWDVRSAAAHYERGRQALDAERYSAAIQEFNAARILAFPYRDADTLAAEAAAALNSGMTQEAKRQTRLEAAVRANIKLADKSLMKGDAAAAARALTDARERVPEGELSGDSLTLALLHALATRLNNMCRRALAEGHWRTAAMCAQAPLVIDPEDAAALRFTAKARRGAEHAGAARRRPRGRRPRTVETSAASGHGRTRRLARLPRRCIPGQRGQDGAGPQTDSATDRRPTDDGAHAPAAGTAAPLIDRTSITMFRTRTRPRSTEVTMAPRQHAERHDCRDAGHSGRDQAQPTRWLEQHEDRREQRMGGRRERRRCGFPAPAEARINATVRHGASWSPIVTVVVR